MIYGGSDPDWSFPVDTDAHLAASLQVESNLEEIRTKSRQIYDWYVNRLYPGTVAKRLVNLWNYYNFLSYAGYSYYSKCVLASLAWLVSGIQSPWERLSNIRYYLAESPLNIITTSGYKLPYFYSAQCGAADWHTLGSDTTYYIYVSNDDYAFQRVLFDDGERVYPAGTLLYDSSIARAGYPGFGLCQWTECFKLKVAAQHAGEAVGESGPGNSARWDNWYPYNLSLQCFILEYCKQLNDAGSVASMEGMSWLQWINELGSEAMYEPRYFCFPMTWAQYMSDYTFTKSSQVYDSIYCPDSWKDTLHATLSDEGKFKLTARQWIAHFNEVGSYESLTKDENKRYSAYVNVVKPCFTYWDSLGMSPEENLMNMPEPTGTFNDPWHKRYKLRRIALYAGGRKNKNVRTILF